MGAGSMRSPLRDCVKAGDEAFLFFFDALPAEAVVDGDAFVDEDVESGEGDFFLAEGLADDAEGGATGAAAEIVVAGRGTSGTGTGAGVSLAEATTRSVSEGSLRNEARGGEMVRGNSPLRGTEQIKGYFNKAIRCVTDRWTDTLL